MSTIRVLCPSARSVVTGKLLAARPSDLAGKKIGLLFNTKANADVFLNRVGELLAQHHPAEVTFLHPRNMTRPLLAEFVPEFEKARDCMVGAWGD